MTFPVGKGHDHARPPQRDFLHYGSLQHRVDDIFHERQVVFSGPQLPTTAALADVQDDLGLPSLQPSNPSRRFRVRGEIDLGPSVPGLSNVEFPSLLKLPAYALAKIREKRFNWIVHVLTIFRLVAPEEQRIQLRRLTNYEHVVGRLAPPDMTMLELGEWLG